MEQRGRAAAKPAHSFLSAGVSASNLITRRLEGTGPVSQLHGKKGLASLLPVEVLANGRPQREPTATASLGPLRWVSARQHPVAASIGKKSHTSQRQRELCQDTKSQGPGLPGMALWPHPLTASVAQCSGEWCWESGCSKWPCKAVSDTPAALFDDRKAAPEAGGASWDTAPSLALLSGHNSLPQGAVVCAVRRLAASLASTQPEMSPDVGGGGREAKSPPAENPCRQCVWKGVKKTL